MKWKTAEAFPGFSVINRGFGGNVIEDVLYYYNDTVGKYHPSAILFYCDNDVTGGDSGDSAFGKAMQVYAKVRADFPKVPFVFLSMKHAPNSAFADPGEAQAIDRFNDLAKAQAKKDSRFKYFDMDAPVRDASGKVPGDLFLDGEHFNDNRLRLDQSGDGEGTDFAPTCRIRNKKVTGKVRFKIAVFAGCRPDLPCRVCHGFGTPPPESAIPKGPLGDSVRRGEQIFTATHKYAGPFVGNNLNCSRLPSSTTAEKRIPSPCGAPGRSILNSGRKTAK